MKSTRPPKTLLLLALIGLFFNACASLHKNAPPLQVGPSADSEHLKDWQRLSGQRRSLSALGQVKLKARGQNRTFELALLVRYPDQLVLEALDDLGQRQFYLSADGQEIHFWQDGEWKKLSQNETALKELLGFKLTVEEFIRSLLGLVGEEGASGRQWNPRRQAWRLIRSQDELEFSPAGELKEWVRKEPGKRRQKNNINYSAYDTKRLAHRLLYELFSPHVEIELRLSHVELNLAIPTEKFGPLQGN